MGAHPPGNHHHRIGHHPPISLIGEFNHGVQGGIQGKGAEEIPLPAVLRLVHRHPFYVQDALESSH